MCDGNTPSSVGGGPIFDGSNGNALKALQDDQNDRVGVLSFLASMVAIWLARGFCSNARPVAIHPGSHGGPICKRGCRGRGQGGNSEESWVAKNWELTRGVYSVCQKRLVFSSCASLRRQFRISMGRTVALYWLLHLIVDNRLPISLAISSAAVSGSTFAYLCAKANEAARYLGVVRSVSSLSTICSGRGASAINPAPRSATR